MKISWKIAIIIGLVMVGISTTTYANDGPKVLKVKGLYLGMPLQEAEKIAAEVSQGTWTGDQDMGKGYVVRPCMDQATGMGIMLHTIKADVIKIDFIGADMIFKVHGWSLQEFAKAFIKSYKIPGMDGKSTRYRGRETIIYSFTSTKYGYKVSIDSNMKLEIERIAVANSNSFN